ncbi:uncharacterized protein LOC108680407, partial [Hyalella azteca]|uniref:Uncharacterized protein LOC108680407 n=1 Tax=Hyalella azteca TaxID=294128 RepID=A0A8B7PFD0_HYAAZ
MASLARENDEAADLISADQVVSPHSCLSHAGDETVDLYDDIPTEIIGVHNNPAESQTSNEKASAKSVNSKHYSKTSSDKKSTPGAFDLLDDCIIAKHTTELAAENELLKSEIHAIREQSKELQKNMTCLWKTARMQIKEKDNKIVALQRKYEALVFRRAMRNTSKDDFDRIVTRISAYAPAEMKEFLQEMKRDGSGLCKNCGVQTPECWWCCRRRGSRGVVVNSSLVVVACQFQVTCLKCKSTLQFEVIKFLPLKLSLCSISCQLSNRN